MIFAQQPSLSTFYAARVALGRKATCLVARVCAGLVAVMAAAPPASATTAAEFRAFLESVRPEVVAAGIPGALYDRETANLEPDLSLPDLIIPGRPRPPPGQGQAEFTRHPSEYLDTKRLADLSVTGRKLAATHADTLAGIEAEIGVDRNGLLGIWGRETAFGTHRLPHDAVRVLAMQAWLGRRSEMFRAEFIAAFKLMADGIPRADLRSSWAGAVGLTQFMPTEFVKHAVDFDRDGRIDLVGSVPDALASAARQLKDKGWVKGQPWGYEVILPRGATCALEGPPGAKPLSQWMTAGFQRPKRKPFRVADLDAPAYLMMPAGRYGPAFLVLENFQVLRRYNTSDLYALYVGNLWDRIGGGGAFLTPWAPVAQPSTLLVRELQQELQALGFPMDKIDGKIGSNTRRQIGLFEVQAGLQPGCWPTPEVLAAAKTGRQAAAARP